MWIRLIEQPNRTQLSADYPDTAPPQYVSCLILVVIANLIVDPDRLQLAGKYIGKLVGRDPGCEG
jgi:hypothetical protein